MITIEEEVKELRDEARRLAFESGQEELWLEVIGFNDLMNDEPDCEMYEGVR